MKKEFKMKTLNWSEINELAVKNSGKFGVYVSFGIDFSDSEDDKIWDFLSKEIKKKYTKEFYFIISSIINSDLFLFDSEEECNDFFSMFNKKPVYSSGIYAGTYCPVRGAMDENT